MDRKQFHPGGVAIYVLKDPHTNAVRYVGQTNRPNNRVNGHVAAAKQAIAAGKDSIKDRWVYDLYTRQSRPVLEVVEWVPASLANEREQLLIQQHQVVCNDLVNSKPSDQARPEPVKNVSVDLSAWALLRDYADKHGMSGRDAASLIIKDWFSKLS